MKRLISNRQWTLGSRRAVACWILLHKWTHCSYGVGLFFPSQTLPQTCDGISVNTLPPPRKHWTYTLFQWKTWCKVGFVLLEKFDLLWGKFRSNKFNSRNSCGHQRSQNCVEEPKCREKPLVAAGGKSWREPLEAWPAVHQRRAGGPQPVLGLCVCFTQMYSSLCSALIHLTLYKKNLGCLNRARQRDESFKIW